MREREAWHKQEPWRNFKIKDMKTRTWNRTQNRPYSSVSLWVFESLNHISETLFDQRLWHVVWITWQLSITPSLITETNLTDNWEVYLHCETWFNMFSSCWFQCWRFGEPPALSSNVTVFIGGLKSLCQSKMACCASHFHNSSQELLSSTANHAVN